MTKRELTPIEQAMDVLSQQAGAFNLVMTSCSRGHLSPTFVKQALACAQERHPSLGHRIQSSAGQLYFEAAEAKPIPLRVVTRERIQDWQTVVLEELNQPIQRQHGLMRAVLIPGEDSYLITALHPAIADKESCARLHLDILTDCQTLAADQPLAPKPEPTPFSTLNDLLPEAMQGSRGIEKAVVYLLRTQAQLTWKRPVTLPFEDFAPIESRQCGLVHRQLNVEVIEPLLKACNTAAISLQDAVCAAMLLAVAARLRAENGAKSICLSCQSYLDLRSQLHPPIAADSLAVLESAVISTHTVKPQTSLWELAGKVRKQIDISIQQGHLFSVAVMLKRIVEVYLKAPRSAPATIAVNHLNLPFPSLPDLKAIHFAIGQKVYGGIFSVSLCTFQQQLFFNFIYSDPSLGAETVNQLADQVLLILSRVACPASALASID